MNPIDSFRVTAVESTEVGGAIGRIKADDPDIGRNAEMDYSIVGGHDMFNIITDQTTQEGVLVVRKVSASSSFRNPKIKIGIAPCKCAPSLRNITFYLLAQSLQILTYFCFFHKDKSVNVPNLRDLQYINCLISSLNKLGWYSCYE